MRCPHRIMARGIGLFMLAAAVIIPGYILAGGGTTSITCTPVANAANPNDLVDYWVYGKGTYTYVPSGGYVFGVITVEYGTLDDKGNFTPAVSSVPPLQAKVDKTNSTWILDTTQQGLLKGQSTWIRAQLHEVNPMTLEGRIAASVIVKYTAPNPVGC